MNVNDLCAAPYDTSNDTNHSTGFSSTSEIGSIAREDTVSTALTNSTNTTTTSQYTLPPLSQQQLPKQRLPSLVGLPSTHEPGEDTTMTETSDTSDTLDMKKLIDKCSNLCHNLARYKTLQKDCSENDQETTFDYITHTTHDILDSLVAMQQQREAVVLNDAEYTMIRQARNWKENRNPKYRRRSKRTVIGQRCHSCYTSETPEWRKGPDGARTLCNACGLHYSKLLRKESVTVSSCKRLTNGSPNRDIKQIEQSPSDRQIQTPHQSAYESQQKQVCQQPFHSTIPLTPFDNASTSSPSSSSTSGTINTTSSSSSSSSQPTSTASSYRPNLYHLPH